MDQAKIGAFLKGLRKEKGLTQEHFSEIVHVSNRTVSRWENGNHLPDLDILLEIADFYEVDLREILNGERKSTDMNKDVEETAIKTAEYTNAQTERYNKTLRLIWPHREFCVSDFRQNQEYHVFNVHDGGLFPLVTPVPEGWDGMRAVCGVNAGPAFRESYFRGISLPCGRRT